MQTRAHHRRYPTPHQGFPLVYYSSLSPVVDVCFPLAGYCYHVQADAIDCLTAIDLYWSCEVLPVFSLKPRRLPNMLSFVIINRATAAQLIVFSVIVGGFVAGQPF